MSNNKPEPKDILPMESINHNECFSLMANSADVGLVIIDHSDGEILMYNSAFCRFFQAERESIKGKYLKDIVGHALYERYREKYLSGMSKEKVKPHVMECCLEEGNRWLQFSTRPVTWTGGRSALNISFTDVTWIKKRKDNYKDMAFFDSKLKLPNCVKLERDLKELHPHKCVSLICFDICNLRVINDMYGWEAGDSLLFQIRDWLLGLHIPGSRLYRIDADEFGILVEQIESDEADRMAIRIQRRFTKPWKFKFDGNPPLPLYCAVTMAVVHGSKLFGNPNMINLAQRILRDVRSTGKVTTYDACMDQWYKNSMVVQQKLALCIQNGMEGFTVNYQPIVDPVSGVWRGLEALCRWDCPGTGRISPQEFIPEAERLGMIKNIGEWVLETAVGHCKMWELDKIDDFILDINVSPLQMRDSSLADRVLGILYDYGYPGNKLSLEITESMEFNFDNHCLSIFSTLVRAGINVALDDFGTGYSSFNNLKKLPAGILKTEKSFIDNIESDYYTQQLFRVMVELAHVAQKKLIAEGVETDVQRELLVSHNVDLLQGYLFSKPLPAHELEKQLFRFDDAPARFRAV